jgi:hypothetical protein
MNLVYLKNCRSKSRVDARQNQSRHMEGIYMYILNIESTNVNVYKLSTAFIYTTKIQQKQSWCMRPC